MPVDPLTIGALQNAIDDAGIGWKPGPNSISQLPADERRLRLGLAEKPNGLSQASEAFAVAALPSTFDLRNVNGQSFVTPIRDQGSCGSCVAFGCVAAIEGSLAFQHKYPHPDFDLSEAHLFYCYGGSEGRNCLTGWWPD